MSSTRAVEEQEREKMDMDDQISAKVIHQTWKSATPPEALFRGSWRDSWVRLNPGWVYRLWTDDEISEFVRNEFPRFFPIWRRYPKAIMRVDAWRYLLLKKRGGLYADLDFACLRPLDEWLPTEEGFCCADQGNGELCNAFMWAPRPCLPFLDDIESELRARADTGDVLTATGPGFLTRYASNRGEKLQRLRTEWLYPLPFWAHEECRRLGERPLEEVRERFPAAGAITFWTHSWHGQADSAPAILPKKREKPGAGGVLVVILGPAEATALSRAADETWLSSVPEGIRVRRVAIDGFRPPDGGEEPVIPPGRFGALIRELASDDGFDWALVCLEGAYIALERLREVIDDGADVIFSEDFVTRGDVCLKAGCLISKGALVTLARADTGRRRRTADEILKDGIAGHGVRWSVDHSISGDTRHVPSRFNDGVSVYTRNATETRVVHAIFASDPRWEVRAAGFHWTDGISFYDEGFFLRKKEGDFGRWKDRGDGTLLLEWEGGCEEIFIPMRDERGKTLNQGVVVSRDAADHLFEDSPESPTGGERPGSAAGRSTRHPGGAT